jgi:small conductance mechanosensitive channel
LIFFAPKSISTNYKNIIMDGMSEYLEIGKGFVLTYGLKIIAAILVLLIGLRVVKVIVNYLGKVMEKRNVDVSLRPFLVSMSSALLKVMLFISVIQMLGVATTSFVAILGAAGLAVGLALSGTLQNFAGGVIILLLKPFKVGDFIEGQGFTGSVHSIQIFSTVLKTPDNKTIILPNGPLSTGAIVNYSTEERRRVDMEFGVGYDADIDKVKTVLNRIISEEKRIITEPEPAVLLGTLADSSVNFKVRVWSLASDYWGIYFDFHENVKKAFDAEGISIPFPQMDVHIQKQ